MITEGDQGIEATSSSFFQKLSLLASKDEPYSSLTLAYLSQYLLYIQFYPAETKD